MELEGFLKRAFLFQEECKEAGPHRTSGSSLGEIAVR